MNLSPPTTTTTPALKTIRDKTELLINLPAQRMLLQPGLDLRIMWTAVLSMHETQNEFGGSSYEGREREEAARSDGLNMHKVLLLWMRRRKM